MAAPVIQQIRCELGTQVICPVNHTVCVFCNNTQWQRPLKSLRHDLCWSIPWREACQGVPGWQTAKFDSTHLLVSSSPGFGTATSTATPLQEPTSSLTPAASQQQQLGLLSSS